MASKNHDLSTLVLRLAGGGLMLTHGIPKLNKILSGDLSFADPLGIGEGPSLFLTVFAEVICAGLLMLGVKTKWAVIPLIVTMLVAVFVIHWSDPIGKKEMGLLYLAIYLAIFFKGGGKYSLVK